MLEKLTMEQMQCLSNPSIYSDLPPLGLYPLMFGCFPLLRSLDFIVSWA